MSKTPAIYRSTHRIKFSDLDPYKHMRTAMYSAYYIDHRMSALREQAGWDLKTLERLPFMAFVRRLDIEFIRPVVGDQEISIASFVREFSGPDAHIECSMSDDSDRVMSKCNMVVAYVDKNTNRSADWPANVMDLFFDK
ncbi:MAG TPA: acyl-CoA thioesterase [Steroidobacteraceae bacterium]|nr:acyl-CoA thioesterase [Steroidobacteraceae bacterium]